MSTVLSIKCAVLLIINIKNEIEAQGQARNVGIFDRSETTGSTTTKSQSKPIQNPGSSLFVKVVT